MNILVALLWPAHTQHDAAKGWFQRYRSRGWATCALTQAAFVRIISNPAFSRDALAPKQAAQLLEKNTQAPDHIFWKEDISFSRAVAPFAQRVIGHQQVTDAYLLGLALHNKGILATMDRSVRELTEGFPKIRQSLDIIHSATPED